MNQDIERILITEEQLQTRVRELGRELAEEYRDKVPIFVGVLKGVILFFGDMIRATPIPCQIDLMAVSSYGAGTETSGTIALTKDVSLPLEGRHVVILEDIIDSGLTLRYTVDHLRALRPASLKVCTLLDKPARRIVDISADYVGFTIPNDFVVGYGLDYNDYYRNLPFIGILKPEVYEK
ncbi:MAG: hypoxanthine phosphoribosyltransferase [Oscillospiraceae bacterium]|nr:hypoxanthine phosphoribosyltransferase [Oscillospiraceae bacterium]